MTEAINDPAIETTPTAQAALYKAFAVAQSEFGVIRQNAENDHFGYRYADLTEIVRIVRPILNRHGIALSWDSAAVSNSGTVSVGVSLYHSEGGVLRFMPISVPYDSGKGRNTAQAVGSALTYAKRYAISAALGLSTDEDDDGNAAGAPLQADPPKASGFVLSDAEKTRIAQIAALGSEAYGKAWKALPEEERRAISLNGKYKEAHVGFKEIAERADRAKNAGEEF